MALSHARVVRGPPRLLPTPLREEGHFHSPRCLPSPGAVTLVPGRVSVTGTLDSGCPRSRGFAATSRFSLSLRAWLPPPVREVSTTSYTPFTPPEALAGFAPETRLWSGQRPFDFCNSQRRASTLTSIGLRAGAGTFWPHLPVPSASHAMPPGVRHLR